MKFPLLNIDGTKANSIEISDKLVKLKINHKLIKMKKIFLFICFIALLGLYQL